MEHLDGVIKEYLNKPTEHAVLITGQWGTGKTFYYKNNLEKLISDTACHSNNKKNYRPVYVSLFGSKNLDTVQSEIFLSLYPFLKNNGLKLTLGLGKAVLKGIMAIKNLGDLDEYVENSTKSKAKEALINPEELVICLDDLERRGKGVSLDMIVGYVNTLVENHGAKIIFLANEDKIDKSEFSDLKEKTVGVTVEFIPDFKIQSLKLIDSSYSSAFSSYADFLNNQIDTIINLNETIGSNLRTLRFALDNFHIIYSSIKTHILDVKNREDKQLYERTLPELFRFSLAISIEFKTNQISYSERKDLDSMDFGWKSLILPAIKGEEKIDTEDKTYRVRFMEAYYPRGTMEYKYFEHLYSYITGGEPFELEKFQENVTQVYHYSKNEILPQYEIFDSLKYSQVLQLTEKEYRKNTKKMVEYASQGAYKVEDYLTIYHFALRYDNVIGYNPDKLKSKLIAGAKRIKFKYNPRLDMYLTVNSDNPDKEALNEIRNIILEANHQNLIDNLKYEARQIEELAKKDMDTLASNLLNQNMKWYYTSLFKYISPYKFASIIRNASLDDIEQFKNVILQRYRSGITELRDELEFISGLKKYLAKSSEKRRRKNIRNFQLDLLCKALDEIEKGISE